MKSLLFLILFSSPTWAQTTERVSIRTDANQPSAFPSISADGRFVAFFSSASNLVAGDTNSASDVFVRDLQTGMVERVSLAAGGTEANGSSSFHSISADGRYVAFRSSATNLVPADTNNQEDIFVRDRLLGTTERVSVATGGAQANGSNGSPAISADGRYVAFYSNATNLVPGDTNSAVDVFVHDRQLGTTERSSVATNGAEVNGASNVGSISADGRFVTFQSTAADLVPGDTNGIQDVFVHDRQLGTTERVSVSTGGAEANALNHVGPISADGRYVAFTSDATNLVAGDTNGITDAFLRDRQLGTTERVSLGAGGAQGNNGSGEPSMSPDARFVTFLSFATNLVPGGTNGRLQVLVRDRQLGTTELASLATGGPQADGHSHNPAISADGRFVAFDSSATNLAGGDTNGFDDVFVRDRQLGTTRRLTLAADQADSFSDWPVISADGRCVAFRSHATNLVSFDTNGSYDVFVYDRPTATIDRVSVGANGLQGDGSSHLPALSADGRFVAFESEATNLVPGDTNVARDVFVHDRQTGTTERVSVATGGVETNSSSYKPSISADGRFVAFRSDANNLVVGDNNARPDIFVRDRSSGTTERVNIATGGAQANSYSDEHAISANGRFVVFRSDADNLVAGDTNGGYDVFVHDRQLGTTERVSVATGGAQSNADSYGPCSISADGRFVAFASDGSNLVANDTNGSTDIFVRDRVSGTTELATVATGGAHANLGGLLPSISGDGRCVTFRSDSTNLVAGDTNGFTDVFLRDRVSGTTERVSIATGGAQGNQNSANFSPPAISADGRDVVLDSDASNLVANDTNGLRDIFVRDRGPGVVFTLFCFGDGTGTACPCGNTGSPGNGCANSVIPAGGHLAGSGIASVTADTFVLTGSGMPNSSVLYLQGTTQVNGGAGAVFGGGLRCAGGSVIRLGAKNNTSNGSIYPDLAAGDVPVSIRGLIPMVGGTRTYQAWYRNSTGPCGSVFNLTNGLQATWTP